MLGSKQWNGRQTTAANQRLQTVKVRAQATLLLYGMSFINIWRVQRSQIYPQGPCFPDPQQNADELVIIVLDRVIKLYPEYV
jgi:hypothetical protein